MTSKSKFSADPSDKDFYQNPYPYYKQMHCLEPIFYWQEYDFLCAAKFELVSSLLRDNRLGREITHIMSREDARLSPVSKHTPMFNLLEYNSMLEREPPTHTRLRRFVNRSFVSRKIDQFKPTLEKMCHDLIDRFEGSQIDLLPSYAEIIPVSIIAELLGVPIEMNSQLLDWSHKMVAMYQFDKTIETEMIAEKASAEFYEYIAKIAAERRRVPKDDLISNLVAIEPNQLSEAELVSTCILLLNAGHEATVHAIGNSVKALLENEVNCKSIFSSQASTLNAVEELLRFDPPLHMFKRFVLEDINIGSTELKKGQSIGLLLGAGNHDSTQYLNPERLDFERGGTSQLSFGGGIHFCLGAPLARLELSLALPILFQRLPHLQLIGKPNYANRYHFRGLEQLMVQA